MSESMRGELNKAEALGFMLAGNATITVENTKTGNRFTFKIKRADKITDRVLHFVALLNGPDNETNYSFLGTIFDGVAYKHGKKSMVGPDAPSAKVFTWLFAALQQEQLPDFVKIYHEGRCGRCGRKLTVPESITSGYGPECIHLINAA